MRRLSRPSTESAREITIDLDGRPLPAREGEPLACALLAAGERVFARSVKYHRPRGPYCMGGACSQCLMRVDGVPNLYTCQTPARSGMRLERQNAYPSVKVDIFTAIDWLFPRGLDHHEMFAGVPVAEHVMAKVARHLAGLGLLPDKPAPERQDAEVLRTRVAVVGGGAAGFSAAQVLAERGVPFLLVERDDALGGRLRLVRGEVEAPGFLLPPSAASSVRTQATAFGLYRDEQGPYLAVLGKTPEGPRLAKVYAERFLLAHGGHAPLLPFENNDLPGVFSGKAAALLLERHGLVVGQKIALVGRGPDLYALAERFTHVGSEVVILVDVEGEPPAGASERFVHGTVLKAHGHGKAEVTGLGFLVAGKKRKVACDAIVVSLPAAASFELARQGGARISWKSEHAGFVVEADAEGRTAAKDVIAAGDLTGARTAEAAAESGRRAALAIAAEVA